MSLWGAVAASETAEEGRALPWAGGLAREALRAAPVCVASLS
jgi:hypothetical protein